MPDLVEAGVGFENWAAAREDIAKRFPVGLRGTGAPLPVLLTPARIGDAQFHDIDQRYEVTVTDNSHEAIALTIPAGQHATVDWLHSNKGAVRAMLCEVTAVDLRQELALIAVLFKAGDGKLQVMNLTLDQKTPKKMALGYRALSFLKDKAKFNTARQSAPSTGQVEMLCHAVFAATAEILRFGQSQALDVLCLRADALQLTLLAQALRDLAKDPTADNAMRVSYLSTQACLHG